VSLVVEEEQSLPPPDDVEAVASPSFSGWSSSDGKSKRNLEDKEDAATETPEDSLRFECWEEAERKAEEEEEKMLEEQEALMESFATARREVRPLRAGLIVYRPASIFASKNSTWMHRFARPLQKGARPLRVKNHSPQKAKPPSLPTSLWSPR
jgi:hypothetical protein